ncbi:MAG TPA: helix-turn-helix domain-containing protein, partial [Byssovorax sp.]
MEYLFHMPGRATLEAPRPLAPRASAPRGAPARDRILAAALSLFAEYGVHGTTIPLVMERAGVGGGSLYRVFPSKEALVNAAFRDAKRRLEAALVDGLVLDAAPRALFDDFWARLTAFARREPVAFRFLELQDHV